MPKRKPNKQNLELDLFGNRSGSLPGTEVDWPSADRFPVNLQHTNVKDVVLPDLKNSRSPLIVAGYASLGDLIDFVAECDACESIRIVLGNEPFSTQRSSFGTKKYAFSEEVIEYWSEQGVSLNLSAKVIGAIDLVRQGRLQVRSAGAGRRLHAKIYCGDEAVTLGSSNFTASGLRTQLEANVRFQRAQDKNRFAEARALAENYWQLGEPYEDAFIALLESLLKVVDWQEGLGKACAELLEGEWATQFLDSDYFAATELWPSQRQGIAQALYILSNQGSVLIADATGSGKTKLGVHLISAIQHRIMRSNRLRRGKPVLVCPPLVKDNWDEEIAQSNLSMAVVSHGNLSRLTDDSWIVGELRRAQVLCVDEGHNFLSNKANRTQRLLRNIADHVVLFTATPINRGVQDLLNIADLLGADNLQESTVDAFKGILGFRSTQHAMTDAELDVIREEVQRFTVRRTKRDLNGLIDARPQDYRSKDGRLCRFPTHVPHFYGLGETRRDCELALEIEALTDQLTAVAHFRNELRLSARLKKSGWTEQAYLEHRLISAKRLSRYMVMATLRSSRVALVEHILGTAEAKTQFDIVGFDKTASGAMIRKLYALREKLPDSALSVPLPEWLTDSDAHQQACQADIEIYRQIKELALAISPRRDDCKVEKLLELYRKNHFVIAFDSRPISLALIRAKLKSRAPDVHVLLATGDVSSQRRDFMAEFAPESTTDAAIGLCSDSLSEGVNLQKASTVIHLDMPSVVRIAEQRVGRVDRMDSMHAEVQAWWPEDKEAFRVSSDDRFIERYETVENLLGSNMPLPNRHDDTHRRNTAREMVREYERKNDEPWDGIADAFHPVRSLVEGHAALISRATYKRHIDSAHRVLCRVSLVQARRPWAFFCLSSGEFAAPRWLFMPSLRAPIMTDLEQIVAALRQQLAGDVQSLQLDDQSATLLGKFLSRLQHDELALLPKKKRRALEEMALILEKLIIQLGKRKTPADLDNLETLITLQNVFKPTASDAWPDYHEIASRWLDIIRPIWFEKLQAPRKRPLLLKDVRGDLLARGDDLVGQLIDNFSDIPEAVRPERRIRACILGVG